MSKCYLASKNDSRHIFSTNNAANCTKYFFNFSVCFRCVKLCFSTPKRLTSKKEPHIHINYSFQYRYTMRVHSIYIENIESCEIYVEIFFWCFEITRQWLQIQCLLMEIYYRSRFWVVTWTFFTTCLGFFSALLTWWWFSFQISENSPKKELFTHFSYSLVMILAVSIQQFSFSYQWSNKINMEMELSVIFMSNNYFFHFWDFESFSPFRLQSATLGMNLSRKSSASQPNSIVFSLVWLPTRFSASTRIARKICFDSFSKNFYWSFIEMVHDFFFDVLWRTVSRKSIFQDILFVLQRLRGVLLSSFAGGESAREHVWNTKKKISLEGKKGEVSLRWWRPKENVCTSSISTFHLVCWIFHQLCTLAHILVTFVEWFLVVSVKW